MAVIHGIEANQCGEKPPVSLSQAITREIAAGIQAVIN